MTAGPTTGTEPAIRVRIDPNGAGAEISQHRPSVTRALIGKPVADALSAVPLLLPICGTAQSVAAVRAAETAAGRPADPEMERARDLAALAEQAVSIAWRLAIDWPALIGEAPDAGWVRDVRDLGKPISDAAKAALAWSDDVQDLRVNMPHQTFDGVCARLEALFPEAGEAGNLDGFISRIRDGVSVVASVLSAALDAPTEFGTHHGRLLDADAAANAALEAFAADSFEATSPVGGAAEVGPLAEPQNPLVLEATERFGAGLFTRLLALAMQTQTLRGRLDTLQSRPFATNQRRHGRGIGMAATSRGPVVHAIALDGKTDEPRIADWRVLAPTDWHFAPDGPVASALSCLGPVDRCQRWARLCVASFDPCAPCAIEIAGHA